MEQCFGCLAILFGSRPSRKQRLKYLVNYKDGENQNLGVEFENLVLDDGNQNSYGTQMQAISAEEREYVTKRQYDKILEEQRKVDEQIGKKLFEEEELLRVEEEAFYEAQKEAAKAASATLSLKEKSLSLAAHAPTTSDDRNSLTLEEVEDDFEDFLEEVRNRSLVFRSQYSKEPTKSDDILPASRDRGGDGQSSDDDFALSELALKTDAQDDNMEWDSYTSGVKQLSPNQLVGTPMEKRLDPVGDGESGNTVNTKRRHKEGAPSHASVDRRLAASRMFSITDDEEDMGEFVRA